MTDNVLTRRIIGAAMEVHKQVKLGCGYRTDLLVENRFGVELKSVEALGPIHSAIILTYQRMSGRKLGLLIHFNVTVWKDGSRRFIFSGRQRPNAEIAENAEKNERPDDSRMS